jgi:hypothetical protein
MGETNGNGVIGFFPGKLAVTAHVSSTYAIFFVFSPAYHYTE